MTTNQKYIAGAVVAIIIIVLIVWGASSSGTNSMTATSTATTTTSVTTKAVPGAVTTGKVSVTTIPQATTLGTYFKKDATNVYLYTDTDTSGHEEYTIVSGADPATFTALSNLTVVEQPTEKNGMSVTSLGSGSVAYYKDKDRVYVFSLFKNGAEVKTGIEVVQNASPASFKVLNAEYAKDADTVYALEVPSDADAHASGSYSWKLYDMKAIPNADAATFVVAGSTSGNYDAHDESRTYRGGVEVGAYP